MATFLEQRLTVTEELIVLYEDAIAILMSEGAIQSYTLDTGQTRQTVTKADLFDLQKMLDMLYNRRYIILARMGHGGTVSVGAAW